MNAEHLVQVEALFVFHIECYLPHGLGFSVTLTAGVLILTGLSIRNSLLTTRAVFLTEFSYVLRLEPKYKRFNPKESIAQVFGLEEISDTYERLMLQEIV